MANQEYKLGLIGWPLGHSLSPAIHNAALRAAGLEGNYQLFEISPLPDGKKEMVSLLDNMRHGKLQGLNVTIPHKQAVIPLLDGLTSLASQIGAVNTILLENGQLIGDNTDAAGFIASLTKFTKTIPNNCLILGAGGAARAAAFSLAPRCKQLYIAARRKNQAQQLGNEILKANLNSNLQVLPLVLSPEGIRPFLEEIQLIINATPSGMSPNVNASPWPDDISFPEHAAVYDLIYNPSETLLIKTARNAGLRAQNGTDMLVEQAALAFQHWTGQIPSRSEMLNALIDSLEYSELHTHHPKEEV